MITLIGMIRDEGRYVVEWLTYHWLIGFESFLIFLHECRDETEDKIASLPFHVNTARVSGGDLGWELKNRVYSEGLSKAKTTWSVCLDIDEFLFLPQNSNISDLLEASRFQNVDSIAIHQNIFGSCGHEKSPYGLVIDNYNLRNADDVVDHDTAYPRYIEPQDLFKTVKPIVRTKSVVKVQDSHRILCKRPPVDEVGEQFKQYNFKRKIENIRLNHYFTKSKEDWQFKRSRARLSGSKAYPDYWFEYFSSQKTMDNEISSRFSEKINYFAK